MLRLEVYQLLLQLNSGGSKIRITFQLAGTSGRCFLVALLVLQRVGSLSLLRFVGHPLVGIHLWRTDVLSIIPKVPKFLLVLSHLKLRRAHLLPGEGVASEVAQLPTVLQTGLLDRSQIDVVDPRSFHSGSGRSEGLDLHEIPVVNVIRLALELPEFVDHARGGKALSCQPAW